MALGAMLCCAMIALAGDTPLTPAQERMVGAIVAQARVGGCCDTSVAACAASSDCSLGRRLEAFARWLVSVGRDSTRVAAGVEERCRTMENLDTLPMAPSPYPVAGDPNAPVLISVYVTGSCNLCKHVTARLYESVTDGPMRGRARLEVQPFATGVADRALAAAAVLGAFWPYLTDLATTQERLDMRPLVRRASSLGFDRQRFEELMDSDSLFTILGRSAQAGRANGVEVTPTVFIDHRRYRSFKDPRWVLDAVEYVGERDHGFEVAP